MHNSSASPNLTQVIFSGNNAIDGGGMYNTSSSPVITHTVFSGNTAAIGGGIYNNSSSPVINYTVFSGNTATIDGGGIANTSSSPVISNTVFSGNTASQRGGGVLNGLSSLEINNTVFSGNTANQQGGGMANVASTVGVVGVVFTGNSASNGGGMWNNNNGEFGAFIVNTIFSGNTTNHGAGFGPDLAVLREAGGGTENIHIAGSVLGIGLPASAQPTNAIVGYGGSDTMNIFYHHLKNGAVNLGTPVTTGGLTYPPITTGSSAIDLGLYVRRSGTTYYFSEDDATWYDGFLATGGWDSTEILPPDAEDLSATDITGKGRTGRPDAGVFELQ